MSVKVSKEMLYGDRQSLQGNGGAVGDEAGNRGPRIEGPGAPSGAAGRLGQDHISLANFRPVKKFRKKNSVSKFCNFCGQPAAYEVTTVIGPYVCICLPCSYNMMGILWSIFHDRFGGVYDDKEEL
jgi:hypothetical protein